MSSCRKQERPNPSGKPAGARALKAWTIVGFAVLALAAGGLMMMQRYNTAPRQPSTSSPSTHAPSPVVPDEQQVFAGYAGSASCKGCHEAAFEGWRTSHHGLAERALTAALDEPAFQPARTFRHGSQHTDIRMTNGLYKVATLGPASAHEPFAVERVIGHDPLRQFLVKLPGGRLQTLEASYDPRSNEWFNVYGSEDRQPGEWGHWTGRGMNWNSMCAGCHNTRVRKNYDEATDSFRTTMAEMTGSCESCHGPLKAHNDWQRQHGTSGAKDPTVPKLTRRQTMDNCGFCHARRSDLTGDFKPGDDFFDHMRLSMVDETDTYYPDGQVREENYEFSAFQGSRMHLQGVTCADCHHPHTAKTLLPGNWLCMRCHGGSATNAPVIEPLTHSRHKVFGYDMNGALTNVELTIYKPKEIKETGGECVNCHMPQTAYMQRHWRHDHGFTIPDPLLTKQHGIPNACNRCHLDKDVDWSIEWVERWYGAKMDRPSRRRAQVIASARAGAAGARDGLLVFLASEPVPYWRAVASGLLERWAVEPPVREALLRGLADTNALVREACVRSLAPLAETEAAFVGETIQRRLDDPARNVRVAAAWALRSRVEPSSKAGSELLHSLDINADQPTGQMLKGAYALARNDPQRALGHYKKAVQWDPNSAPFRHDLAVVLSSLNRGAEAVAHLEKACALEPRNVEYRYLLALGWNEVGETGKTIEALQTAVQLDPRHGPAWYNLGLALNSAGRAEEGLVALTRAESTVPDDPRSPYARATILSRLGRLNEARQAARRALEIQPDYAPAQAFLRSLP